MEKKTHQFAEILKKQIGIYTNGLEERNKKYGLAVLKSTELRYRIDKKEIIESQI